MNNLGPSSHALLSPSAAARWLECTMAPTFEKQFPDKSSEYAAEGTIAHAVAQLATECDMGTLTEEDFNTAIDILKTDDLFNYIMLTYGLGYASFITDKAKQLTDAKIMLEMKLDISMYAPECFGTGDCVIVGDKTLEIVDYKYGKGVAVSAVENPQMKLYALGAIQLLDSLYDIEIIRMTIYQPRLANGISTYELTKQELLDWGENYVKPRAKLAFEGKGEFKPSDTACRFCKAGANCAARAKFNIDLFDSVDPKVITSEEAANYLAQAADIKAWLTALENRVYSELLSGCRIPGWKLVQGKSNRKYADEKAVIEKLEEEGLSEEAIFDKKLNSITVFEKVFGKAKFAELLDGLIIKPEGKPTLVPESDARPEIVFINEIVKDFDK